MQQMDFREVNGADRRQTRIEAGAYAELAYSLRCEIENHARAIRGLLEDTTKNVIQIGLRLNFVRSCIGRRCFQAWLRSEFQWSQPVASNYMAAAREFSELDCVGKFQPSALFALARKKVPRSAREEAVRAARQGEYISKSRAVAIISKYQKGQKPSQTRAGERVRRYLKSLLKHLPDEAAPEVISELLRIAEELRRSRDVTDQSTPSRDGTHS
jgi:hypothetical protein